MKTERQEREQKSTVKAFHFMIYRSYTSQLFTPFVSICSHVSFYICYLRKFSWNKTHRLQCSSANDVCAYLLRSCSVQFALSANLQQLLLVQWPEYDHRVKVYPPVKMVIHSYVVLRQSSNQLNVTQLNSSVSIFT